MSYSYMWDRVSREFHLTDGTGTMCGWPATGGEPTAAERGNVPEVGLRHEFCCDDCLKAAEA